MWWVIDHDEGVSKVMLSGACASGREAPIEIHILAGSKRNREALSLFSGNHVPVYTFNTAETRAIGNDDSTL